MNFNSVQYLLFFVAALGTAWALVGAPRARLVFLLLASLFFYASNNHWVLVLLLVCIQIDYYAGIKIQDARTPKAKKAFLTASLVSNLGMLAFFKYFNFFASSVSASWVDLNIILPIGISFYTFESMSYTIDVYRGVLNAERSWLRFAFFVSFFPKLVAGPIIRPRDFLPQLDFKPKMDAAILHDSLFKIFQGLCKKMILADFLGVCADRAFNAPETASFVTAILGAYSFTFQIYFDFSGYTDIAIGCSQLLGYTIPENFRKPYASRSITEFWQRWHISLSQWLRDYLYIPLGGNQMKSRAGIYRNLLLTMALGGLWHGAAWHFVLWGVFHGVVLVVERHLGVSKGKEPLRLDLKTSLSLFATFHLVVFSWILFRIEDNQKLASFLEALGRFDVPTPVTNGMIAACGIIVFGWISQIAGEKFDFPKIVGRFPVPVKAAAYAFIAAAVMIMGSGELKPFIYFQF